MRSLGHQTGTVAKSTNDDVSYVPPPPPQKKQKKQQQHNDNNNIKQTHKSIHNSSIVLERHAYLF